MKTVYFPRIDYDVPPAARLALPALSIMLGSMLALMPVIATAPVVPPFGFVMLLGWRLWRADLIAPWAGIPLGLFDDMFSGAPIGSGVATWIAALLAIEVIDQRWLFRDNLADWSIATVLIGAQLVIAWMLSAATGAVPMPLYLIPQWMAATLCWPAALRFAARLDRWRSAR